MMYKSSVSLALSVCNPNHSITDHMDLFNNSLSWSIRRIQFPWISLKNSLPPLVLIPSLYHLSKQAIFIPTHNTITSAKLARLFVVHVFSKHRVPSNVTSDCSSEFVSHFFCSLGTALDMRLHFTSGYHLEANGQVEQTN